MKKRIPMLCIKFLYFVAHSYCKRYNSLQKYEKQLDYVSDFIIFCMVF